MGEFSDLAAGYNARARESKANALYLASSVASLMRAQDPAEAYAELLKTLDPLDDDDYRQAALDAGLHPPPDEE